MMFYELYRFFNRRATWPIVGLLVVIIMLASQAFAGRRVAYFPNDQLLDDRRWYTPADVSQLLNDLGDRRYIYGATELSLDLIYPISYGLLFAVLISQLWGPRRDWMLLAPILTVFFDLSENALIVYMISTYNGSETNLAWVAAVCTLSKTLFFLLSLLLILNGGILGLFRTRYNRSR
jgi:hypothetical protein